MLKYSSILKWAEGERKFMGPASMPSRTPLPDVVDLSKGESIPGPYTPYEPGGGKGKVKLADGGLIGTRDFLPGPYPHDTRNTNEYITPDQIATFAFSGAHPSDTYSSVHDDMPRGVATYRYNDRKLAVKQIADLYKKGIRNFRLVGHSRGGYAADRTAAWIQKHYPDATVETHLMDPVVDSWLKRFWPNSRKLKSKGAKVYMPSNPHTMKYDGKWSISNPIAMLGGRMNTDNAVSHEEWQGIHEGGKDQERLNKNVAMFGKSEPDAQDMEWYNNTYPHMFPGIELDPRPIPPAPPKHIASTSYKPSRVVPHGH